MERANLKVRHRDIYNRMVAEWYEWNATMLPEIDASFTDNFTGDELADHIGTPVTNGKADNPAIPKASRPMSGQTLNSAGHSEVARHCSGRPHNWDVPALRVETDSIRVRQLDHLPRLRYNAAQCRAMPRSVFVAEHI